MTERRELHFIKDSAASEDFFGGHHRVASALAHLLRDRAVRLIALLGPWGSGKSTVVRLAEQSLAQVGDKPTTRHFFIFDAWLHQSDSPRRALIESLIAFVRAKQICPNVSWDATLEEIQRKAETQEIQTTPSLTAWGFMIGMSILLMPLGVRIADSATVISLWPRGFLYANVLGVMITLLPFALVLSNYLAWRTTIWPFNKKFWSQANWTKHKDSCAKRTMASMFFNKAVERTTNRILKTPEPTSFEFRNFYSSIMDAVESAGHSLVIVVDNLDRVPADEAITFWSTIRSLLVSDSADELQAGRPWVVVPLDVGAIGRIFKSSATFDANDQAVAFVEKTFDAVLTVTPPVTSDWQNYIKEKLAEAMPGSSTAEEQHIAIKIYEAATNSSDRSNTTTPRKINSYINKIVSIILQWDAEVPFYAPCYYAAFGDQLEQFSDVLSDMAPAAPLMEAIDADWRKNVAAIHFGVPTTKALQILMEPEISSAIAKEDDARFVELAQLPGFEIVLGKMVSNFSRPVDDANLLSVASLFDAVKSDTYRAADIWRGMLSATTSLGPRTRHLTGAPDGVKALVSRGGADVSRRMLKNLETYTGEAVRAGGAAWFAEAWACDPGDDQREKVARNITVPGDVEFYLQVLDAAVKADAKTQWYELFEELQPNADREEVVSAIVRQGQNTNFNDTWFGRFDSISRIVGTWDRDPIFEVVDSAIRNSSAEIDLSNAVRALLSSPDAAKAKLPSLAAEGVLAHRVASASSVNRSRELAPLLVAIAAFRPEIDPNQDFGNSSDGVNTLRDLNNKIHVYRAPLVKTMVEILVDDVGVSALIALVSVAKSEETWKSLVSEVVASVAETAYFESYSADSVIGSASKLSEVVGNEVSSKIMKVVSTKVGFTKSLTKLDDENFFVVAEAILAADLHEDVREAIYTRVGAKSKEWWFEQIGSRTVPVRVLERLNDLDDQFELSEEFFSAVHDYLKDITQGDPGYPQSEKVDWSKVLLRVDDDRRSVLDQNIIDRLRDVPQNLASCALYIFGEEILRDGVFERDADRNVRQIIVPIVAAAERDPLSDLRDTAKLLTKSIELAAKATRAEIGRVAKAHIDGANSDALKELLAEWKISIPGARKPRGRGKEGGGE